MGLMADFFKRGYVFSGETGLKTGANLEDLVTRAVPAASTQLVDQSTLEDYADAAVVDDWGAAVRRLRVKAGSIGRSHLAADGRVSNRADVLAFHSYITAAQTINAGAFTVVTLDTEVFDYGSCFNVSTYKFTPNVAGVYQITGKVRFGVTQGDVAAVAIIYKNGAQYMTGTHSTSGTTDIQSSLVAGLVEMNGSTDYVQLVAYNGDSVARALSVADAGFTYFCGYLVGKA